MSWEILCATSQASEDYPFGAKVAGKNIGVFLVDGASYAIENICPHAYALLSQGFVENGKVECPLHEAVFDIRGGRCLRDSGRHDPSICLTGEQGSEVQIDMAAQQAAGEMIT